MGIILIASFVISLLAQGKPPKIDYENILIKICYNSYVRLCGMCGSALIKSDLKFLGKDIDVSELISVKS